MERAFARRGGDALREWIDACPNAWYSALAHAGGAAWRQQLTMDLGGTAGIREILDDHDDEQLHRLMTNLGGHDLDVVLDAFHGVDDSRPTCFIAYTIKGYGLPLAGHKDNHAGLLTPDQIAKLRQSMSIGEGEEWERFSGLESLAPLLTKALDSVPFARAQGRQYRPSQIAVPSRLEAPGAGRMSTQEGFGRLLSTIARDHSELADRVVTTSPDVTVSTNLGSWVNRRGVFSREAHGAELTTSPMSSPQKWTVSAEGQHIELGIAENNLFLMLAALGLSAPLFGARLLPIGTVYDPFINRGLDALNYACYQDARFILVATPSGLSLAPEGGAHQSVYTPLIGMGQPSMTAFEPAYVDELCEIMRWSFEHIQHPQGGSVYLRLSTRPLEQRQRSMTPELAHDVVEGAYWLKPPAPDTDLAIVASGAVVQEAMAAYDLLAEDVPDIGLLVVTSAARLHRGWLDGRRHGRTSFIEEKLAQLFPRAGLVTVLDGHAATLSWLGAVHRHDVIPLGIEKFGQSGSIPDLYRTYGIDHMAIVDAVARLCVARVAG
jgi:pyruvate dehydrogenase E1 component